MRVLLPLLQDEASVTQYNWYSKLWEPRRPSLLGSWSRAYMTCVESKGSWAYPCRLLPYLLGFRKGIQRGWLLSEAWRVPRRQGGKEARMNREETVFGASGGVGTSW